MDTPQRIAFAAQRLKEGHRINRLTVRDFLRHFGSERRGAAIVRTIRGILDSLDLETDPDFETAWIDGPIWVRLKNGNTVAQVGTTSAEVQENSQNGTDLQDVVLESTPAAVALAEQQSESAPTSEEPESPKASDSAERPSLDDPTFRIGSFPAANKKLIVVNQNDSVNKAITLMLQYDFSQLPVMQGEREVKGVVTWKSIAAKREFVSDCNCVGDCRDDARIVDSNRTLFDAIPIIMESGYVLVRDQRDRRITGIVTTSDLSSQFQDLAEPFLLLREIELHVRQLLADKVTVEDFRLLDAVPASIQMPQNIADLSFGQYVRLLQHPEVWKKLKLNVDAGVLTSLLEGVRIIRNDVMHFDPDPMTKEELDTLKGAVRFMQQLYELMP